MMIGLALGHRVRRIASLAALVALGGCFATRNDVRIVQSDVASLRTEMLRNDTELRNALTQAVKQLSVINDSLSRMSARTVSIQGDVRGEMRDVKEQLLQIQALVGQSQSNLNRMRSELEERNRTQVVQPPYVPPAGATTAMQPPAAGQPLPVVTPVMDSAARAADSAARQTGPAQLYQSGLDLMKRGSNSTARTLFQELLSVYPTSDLAPDAQYYIAESLDKEKNVAGADAAYAAVVTKYGDSPRASTALYKRAQIAVQQGNTPEAKKMLEEVIKRFPRSIEAGLAADQLKELR